SDLTLSAINLFFNSIKLTKCYKVFETIIIGIAHCQHIEIWFPIQSLAKRTDSVGCGSSDVQFILTLTSIRNREKSFYNFSYSLSDIEKSLVTVPPLSDWLTFCGKCLELSEGHFLPIGGTKNDRNDTCFSCFVSFHSSFHFNTVAV